MFNNVELNRQLLRLENLIAEAKARFEPDDELQSHLAKYICVLTSGFIENAVYNVFSDIVDKESQSVILCGYAKTELFKIQNPNSQKLMSLVRSFHDDWHIKLKHYLQEEDRGAAINYILKDRHKIAHGKDSDITISKLEGYLKKTVQVFRFVEMEMLVVIQ